ncbi:MAG TPA: ABC transporter ATP-binding protein [Candidatus Binatia bacterium]|jgi:branched-chain amino acid transport system ATP-binding protein
MLEVKEIHTYYGESYVLQGVSLALGEGEVVAVLGRNGVGKTTLIRSITGLTPPRRGRILFQGRDITDLAAHQIARLGFGLVPQGRRIFPSLSVRENLVINQCKGPNSGWGLSQILDLFPVLKHRLRNPGNHLSGGEQQMLACGRALISQPAILLMDEPSEGLAPLLVRELGRILQRLKETGVSILIVEQNLGFALRIADRVYLMSKGKIVHESLPKELWENEEIKARYLGV